MARNENTPDGGRTTDTASTSKDPKGTAQGNTTAQPGSKGAKEEDRQLGRAHGGPSAQSRSDLSRPNAGRDASGRETFGKAHDAAGNRADAATEAEEDVIGQEDLDEIPEDDGELDRDDDDRAEETAP